MSNNIYDILGKLTGLKTTENPVETAKEPVYESVEPRGDIMEAVRSLEEKYMGFKKTVAAVKKGGSAEDPEAVAAAIGRKKYGKEKFQKAAATGKKLGEDAKPDFLDLDKDGDTEEPMKQAAKDAKEHEPAKPDSDAVAKRKRLQAIKDRQEDERAEKGDYDSKSSARVVKGRAYGGAAQKDAEEKDDLEESRETDMFWTIVTNLFDKKGYKTFNDLTPKDLNAIAKEFGYGFNSHDVQEILSGPAAKKQFRAARQHNDKLIDLKGVMSEVAPPGAKAERMVKHIKKGYSKDGKLTPKEKGIAYATAWKAHNKGQVEEGHEFGSKDFENAANLKKAPKAKLKESAMMEASSYTYEKVADILSAEQPHLDPNGDDFQKAVYNELIKMHLSPKSARWNVYYDEDFLSDCASAYAHNLKHGQEHEPLVDAVEELDEIARLAGLPAKHEETCNECGMVESACACDHEVDEGDVGKTLGSVAGAVLAPELGPIGSTVGGMIGDKLTGESADLEEEEMDEGNEFTKARLDAIAQGKDTFTVGGKVHKVTGDVSQEKTQVEESTVTEDVNINISANGEEDFVKLIKKLSGLPLQINTTTPLASLNPTTGAAHGSSAADEGAELDEERDIEWDNTPEEQTAPLSASIPSGNDLHKAKKQDPATANKAANPLEEKKVEESLWKAYEDMINDVKE